MPDLPFALDTAQKAVVGLEPAASGVVIGAPGSGKTATLVSRVVALIDDGMRPDEVVVLTPTRTAATALRDRLAVGVRVATSGPLARSVPAFAYQVVRSHAVHAGDEPPQLLTGPDEDRIIGDLLAGDAEDEADGPSRWPEWLPADIRSTPGLRAEIRAFLAEMTTLGIEPEELAARAAATDRPVWASLASFAREYRSVRARMRGAHRDAAGLVREAVGLLRNAPAGSPALGAVAGLRAILVDDAQELTLGGVELLEACRRRGIAVLAFGDPDVGSGSFRGARPENFARLATRTHVLDRIHRGMPAQRDLVAQVTSRIGAAGLVAHRHPPVGVEPDESLRAFALRSGAEEVDLIARLLRERHVHDGVPWEQLAVIAHDSRQVTALEAELSARDVPTAAVGPARALAETPIVRDLLRAVDLAAVSAESRSDDEVLDVLVGGGLDPVELRRLRAALRHAELRRGGERSARELLASGVRHPVEFDVVDTPEARRAARLSRTLAEVAEQIRAGATAHELLWTVWEQRGLERQLRTLADGQGPLADQARRDLDAVVALFEAAKRHGERKDGTAPIDHLRALLHSEVAEDRLRTGTVASGVQISTPAAALGLEFDTVVVAGVQDGVWPNLRLRGSLLETARLAEEDTDLDTADRRRAVLHDELRLFARAVSRARSRLIVTAVDDDDTGPSVLFDLLPPASPAPRSAEHPLTLRGLVAAHRRRLTDPRSSESDREDAAGQLALLAAAGVPGAHPAQWYGLAEPTSTAPLRDLDVAPLRVSPSRIHALEQCQLDWAIGDLGGDPGTAVAGLGTLLHGALEHVATADEEALWSYVEDGWSQLEFEAPWIDEAERRRARDLVTRLAAYLRDTERAGTTLVGAEPHFEVELPVPDAAHPAILSGYIDRVERTRDGRVVIVDLKTGRSEATGERAALENPQLAAYQLAFERGAIPAAAGAEPGGAKLLVLKGTRHGPYAEPRQEPFDDETRAAFLGRVDEAVRIMRGTSFVAPFEEHCRDDHTRGLCRIHTIGPVSSA
ncbi:ATP-dependent helicase [Microbacterium sp. CnD16-F]|uniref:ATP-dependent helicase n=1 Tax=Microbacterium sp. CnD16-F TaxID=2954493 RepID=UPI002097450C|nr:ATP-dependent DNA helicase [Microbacterium sp. CnD16-F]MCO7202153.1 ATP-dependent helicase [Microbacterium sp. CnD16-F]